MTDTHMHNTEIGVTRIDRINGRVYLLQSGEYVRLADVSGKTYTLGQTT